ncbi:MAG: high-affinity nickel-transporter [Candidatus Gottesmanbacteria bacterium GW2011_GWA2_43_14]|uniref:High-affinity nickel-transporter n=1 Tax=Candidatus Gottesmanbacteria bacterium GW2011_GWA2_43_14 TaxID=1618443 RepID=A0A0G1FMB1_9BACT|nr:MAG: high-affinity nickel-transporter [Candidatus Gottesmanbacteria bacterium GW2011_GWA2_43_14]
MNTPIAILALGFILGIKHAFDADHIVAVSTIVRHNRQPLHAALVGTFWGMGHTTTFLLIGLLVLILKINIPQSIGLFLELLVGLMLVFLGIRTFLNRDQSHHKHIHRHGQSEHLHAHEHFKKHQHQHRRSFFIGTVHGTAGSGALMILMLSTIRSTVEGIYYILLFGLGSIGAMTIMTLLLGLPFSLSKDKFPHINNIMNQATGAVSAVFGLIIIYEVTSLFLT